MGSDWMLLLGSPRHAILAIRHAGLDPASMRREANLEFSKLLRQLLTKFQMEL